MMLTRIKRVINKLRAIPKKLQNEYEEYIFKKRTAKALYEFNENWFKDKRVAIIGGADSALKEKLGKYIDGFDVVVRINKGVEIIEKYAEYIGTRTDVLMHAFFDEPGNIGSSPITPDLWKEKGVARIIFALNYSYSSYCLRNFRKFISVTKGNIKLCQIPQYLFKKNSEALGGGFGPTTGFIAINTVFNCQPKELFITGITFFKTSYNLEYRKEKVEDIHLKFEREKSHNPGLEFNHIKKLYQNSTVINPDQTLKRLLEKD